MHTKRYAHSTYRAIRRQKAAEAGVELSGSWQSTWSQGQRYTINKRKGSQCRSPHKALAKISSKDKGHIWRSKRCIGMLRTEPGLSRSLSEQRWKQNWQQRLEQAGADVRKRLVKYPCNRSHEHSHLGTQRTEDTIRMKLISEKGGCLFRSHIEKHTEVSYWSKRQPLDL